MASRTVDNAIALRVLYLLVQNFTDTDAYRLGIIDEHGNNLIKTNEFTTQEQSNAYTYLDRLVFNLKKIINKLPGGESKLKSSVAALFLIKEAYAEHTTKVDPAKFELILSLIEDGVIFAEEHLIVEEFFQLMEDGITVVGTSAPQANVTGPDVCTNEPVIDPKRRKRPKVQRRANRPERFPDTRSHEAFEETEVDNPDQLNEYARRDTLKGGAVTIQAGMKVRSFIRRPKIGRYGMGFNAWSRLKRRQHYLRIYRKHTLDRAPVVNRRHYLYPRIVMPNENV